MFNFGAVKLSTSDKLMQGERGAVECMVAGTRGGAGNITNFAFEGRSAINPWLSVRSLWSW